MDGALGKESEARLKVWDCFGELVCVDDGSEDAFVEELLGKLGRANWCAEEAASFEEFDSDGRVGWAGAGGDGVGVDCCL